MAESFRQAFPEKQQTLVYRQPEIAGLEQLEKSRAAPVPARQTGAGRTGVGRTGLVAPELVSL